MKNIYIKDWHLRIDKLTGSWESFTMHKYKIDTETGLFEEVENII